MPKELSPEKRKRADALAVRILEHSRNMLIMQLRFLEQAVGLLTPVPYDGTVCTDGESLFFDCRFVLAKFQMSEQGISRVMLHIILHCVFRHFIISPAVERRSWDLACDIAVEQLLTELGYPDPEPRRASKQSAELTKLKSELKYMNAEKIYEYLRNSPPHENRFAALEELFREDSHEPWYIRGRKKGRSEKDGGGDGDGDTMTVSVSVSPDDEGSDSESENSDSEIMNELEQLLSDIDDGDDDGEGSGQDDLEEQWRSVSQHIQLDLESFSKMHGKGGGSLVQSLQAVNRERYDYSEFLRRFAVYGEEMKTDEDSFDYNFYCYGLSQYGNAAIIEPLEYSDVKRVREFVIAIDTSGSVAGDTVQKFLQKTYNILKQQESFFSKVNIHIIQCDAEVQEDAKITTTEEFDEYLKTIELRGFGGTDFRPVFRYVNKMVENREFEDLRGLIYFTDGCGTFPEKQPPYSTAFVFLDDEYNNYDVPVWAIKLILQREEI